VKFRYIFEPKSKILPEPEPNFGRSLVTTSRSWVIPLIYDIPIDKILVNKIVSMTKKYIWISPSFLQTRKLELPRPRFVLIAVY